MNPTLEPRACRMLFWALLLVFQICGGPLWGFSVGARDVSGRALPFFPELKSTLPGQTGTPTFGYAYRPDGGMTGVTENLSGTVRSYTYAYGDQGLLVDRASAKARTSPWRTVSIPSRDDRGRISAASTTLAGQSNPVFNQAWTFAGWKDSKITGYVRATTGAEPENWSYGYDAETPADLVSGRSRLTRETPPANLAPTQRFAFDFGKSGGLGVRTSAATGLNQTPAFHHAVAEAGGLNPFARTEKESVHGISWTNGFDARGNVVSRAGSDGSTQQLAWDALGRLISVTTPGVSESQAYYDGFNRRIRTEFTPSNGATQTLDSAFDPHIEFLELAVTASQEGQRVWKVYGPDVSGVYGGAQGVGGLEALVDEATGTSLGVVNDLFGNVAGTVGGDLSFKSSLRVGAYGPLPGQTAVDTGNLLQSLATATVWQGRRLDPTGFYWMGARYYDPGTGRFLSPDPLGHGASLSLYDYAGGDPVNQLDPDGRCVSKVPSYNGDFPSPLNVMNYTPKSNELNKMYYTPSEIRGWVNDAANYHHVPPLMLATILQQDNGPNATGIRKLLQFAERELTTGLATADSMLFDLLPDKIMGKNITGGSSGLANMSRTTLQGAANYIQTAYNRSPMPSGVQYRVLGINVDTRIPAYDRRADLYYASAHLRQLIDYVTGQQGFDANQLTIEQAQNVFKKYNGSGVQAVKYGEDAVQRIYNAMGGKEPLYFFQK